MTDTFTASVRACELTTRNLGDTVKFVQVGRSGASISGAGTLISLARVNGELIRFKLDAERYYLRWDTRVTVTRERGKGPITERPRAPKTDDVETDTTEEPTTLRLYAGDLGPAHYGSQVEFNAGPSIVHGELTAAAPVLDDMVALTLDGESILLPSNKPVTVLIPAGTASPTAPDYVNIDIENMEFA